jgi:hypothetical protein
VSDAKNSSVADIQATLAAWSERERGTLAAWLLDSLPPHGAEDASASSIEEAVRRCEELDHGTMCPMSADEFWSGIGRECQAHRSAMQ